MRYEETTSGTFDAITLADARLHLKEPTNITVEDDLVKSYIRAASKTVEFKTNRVISSSTWSGYLDEWPLNEVITINKAPITSITSVQYYDGDNALQTLVEDTDYIVDKTTNLTRIYMVNTPSVYTRPNAVKVIFVAGYSSISNVDERIKQIVRLMIADYKQLRTDYVTGTIVSKTPRSVDYLINQLKIDEL